MVKFQFLQVFVLTEDLWQLIRGGKIGAAQHQDFEPAKRFECWLNDIEFVGTMEGDMKIGQVWVRE